MGQLSADEEGDSADSLLREAVDLWEPSSIHAPPSFGLKPGDVLSDRFVIDRLAGSGGMGVVHRGTDLVTHEAVALKVMARLAPSHVDRFVREATVLAELSHPAIVRYVAHGTTALGMPFLAMEWLDGEDLSSRLARLPLTLEESLSLMRHACEGIAVAHARAVVHRDIKPSNLFLVDGRPASLKVLDFGIAQQKGGMRSLTQSGMVLGTVGYMSPEQAMAAHDVDARTDVFALGCVLFECLTGRAAFAGPNPVAVLAKVLRDEPPRIAELRPELGGALDALVARMLTKNVNDRPKDAAAVLRALAELVQVSAGGPSASGPSPGLTGGEQKIVSVILGKARPDEARVRAPVTREQVDADVSGIRELTSRFGAEPVVLRGGALLVVLSDRGAASDQVGQAATCALLLRGLRPELRLGVATGCAETTGRIPVGAAIDRAAALLAGADDAKEGIAIDELTAGLLDPGFDVRREGASYIVVGQRADFEATRLLMGKPIPFVGRDKELGLLDLTLRECIDESVARAVLVTGPAGQGKSRLRHEFVAKARERGDVGILIARADPVGAGSAFVLARQLVRRAVGLNDGDPAIHQHGRSTLSGRGRWQAKVRAYLAELCKGADVARMADFLGELIGAPSSESPSPQLRAARSDPKIMAEWLRRSFGEWLAAECAARPLLLVLEDLHWGDLPSVTYLGEGLRAMSAKPLMVLALARPEVHHTFPSLWAAAGVHEVPLGGLTRRAAERLVRAALGETTEDAVARIIECADGNPFYLEELIRRVAEGGDDTLPETVLALVQSRLEGLEPEARRIVRAASVFGEVFWQGAVAALLGGAPGAENLGGWMKELVQREVLSALPESRFPGQREYVFRHGLLREAAYAMLIDADRTLGHALAGEWLERAGETDSLTLADHFERGGQRKSAVPWLVKAAQAAVDGVNLEAAIVLGHRGIACGPDDAQRGLLRQVQGEALCMRGEWPAAVEVSREAMDLLPVGTTQWFASAAAAFQAGMLLGDPSVTVPVLQAILAVPVQPEPSGPYGVAVFFTCLGLALSGQVESACAFLKRAEAIGEGAPDPNPVFVLRLRIMRSLLDVMAGELGSSLANLLECRDLADRMGDAYGQATVRMCISTALAQTGNCDRTAAAHREVLSFCGPRGLVMYSDWSTFNLALVRTFAHRADEAIALLPTLLDRSDRLLATGARAVLGQALAKGGDWVGATREAKVSLQEGSVFPLVQTAAFGVLALDALRRGQAADALALAERMQVHFPMEGSTFQLTRVEALHALGRTEDAHAAIREARVRVLRIAATLDDPELRESFLTNIDANARTLTLAKDWLGEGPS